MGHPRVPTLPFNLSLFICAKQMSKNKMNLTPFIFFGADVALR